MFENLRNWWFLRAYEWHRWRLDRALRAATVHMHIVAHDLGVENFTLKHIDTWVMTAHDFESVEHDWETNDN